MCQFIGTKLKASALGKKGPEAEATIERLVKRLAESEPAFSTTFLNIWIAEFWPLIRVFFQKTVQEKIADLVAKLPARWQQSGVEITADPCTLGDAPPRFVRIQSWPGKTLRIAIHTTLSLCISA